MKHVVHFLASCLIAFVLPTPLSAQTAQSGAICFTSPTKPNIVSAKSVWKVNSDGTVTIRTTFAKTFVDNTYGANAIGWPNGHKFNDLVGSDHVELALYDATGTKRMDFKVDYISASSTAPSGYRSLGVTGGDGKMILGSASDVVSATTSLDQNFNTFGYVLTTNSPATDANYTPNPTYPNWIYDVWYQVTVKQSAFGPAGFGYPSIASVHASPSKTGNNSEIVIPGPCPCNVKVTGTVTNATCNGSNTGAINLTITGSSGTPTIMWSDNVTTQNRTNLKAGTYTVTVTDGSDPTCKATQTFTVGQPAPVSITAIVGNVTTTNGSNGSIDITVTGGTAPYTFKWNDGATTEDRTGLTAGTYTVVVTDAKGCPASKTFTITQPSCSLVVTGTQHNISCFGSNNGSITTSVTGNQGTVTYLWNDGITTPNRSGLTAGTYTVTVKDLANQCTVSKTFTIIQPAALTFSAIVTDVSTAGATDGAINVTVTGGTPPYRYFWSDGITTEDRTGLGAGSYTVNITDANGCSISICVIVRTKVQCNINMTSVVHNVQCYNASNGSIDITITGAVGMVTYIWNDNVVTEDRVGLKPGTYIVTATDEAGCKIARSFTITQPSVALTVTGIVVNTCDCGMEDGAISLNVYGGTAPYTFQWSDGPTVKDRYKLAPGTYTITVTDANGCVKKASFTVSKAIVYNRAAVSPNKGGTTFTAAVSPNPTTGLVKLSIYSPVDGSAIANIVDASGRRLMSSKFNLIKGNNVKELNMAGTSNGVYSVELISNNTRKVLKVMVNR
jgi:hypothetical protein